jgi:hypothetical protein
MFSFLLSFFFLQSIVFFLVTGIFHGYLRAVFTEKSGSSLGDRVHCCGAVLRIRDVVLFRCAVRIRIPDTVKSIRVSIRELCQTRMPGSGFARRGGAE